MLNVRMIGDWARAGMFLDNLSRNIHAVAEATLNESGELILEKLREHIISQDLSWRPLSDQTIRLKGHADIYIESGWLYDNLEVIRLANNSTGGSIFVGASPNKTHPSGVNFNDLMLYLEYGTSRMPARPLIRPTFEQIKNEIENKWKDAILDLARG